jgi:ribosome-binding protein aMBF1 (putative translation factor)
MSKERMVDAIRDGAIITMPESQAREDELFVLRVHGDLPKIDAMPENESRTRRSRDPQLQPKPSVRWHSYQPDYKKNNVTRDLKDNFHWEIIKARKSRNMTRLQLANAVGVPETAIKMIENGELPSDDFILVNKVQTYLGVSLRRDGASFSSAAVSGDLGPAYMPKPDFSKDVSLADLQKMKQQRQKFESKKTDDKPSLSGSDIEILD